MDEIVDFKSDSSAVKFADRFVNVNGWQYHQKSTAGWSLCIQIEGWLNILGEVEDQSERILSS